MALTKARIVDSIERQLGVSQKRATELVEILIESIKNALEKNNDVLVSGFGRFCIKEKKERKGRNPATSETMILPKRKVVTFKCSGKLRNRVNGSE